MDRPYFCVRTHIVCVCCIAVFCLYIDYVAILSHQTSVTPTPMQLAAVHSSESSDWLAYHYGFALSVVIIAAAVIISAILVYLFYTSIRRRCHRSPPAVKYREVQQSTGAVVAPTDVAREESSDAAASTVAGSNHHVYLPNPRGPQPFDGFQPTQEL